MHTHKMGVKVIFRELSRVAYGIEGHKALINV